MRAQDKWFGGRRRSKRTALEAGGVDIAEEVEVGLDLRHFCLELLRLVARVALHPILAQHATDTGDGTLLAGEDADVREDRGAERGPLLKAARLDILLLRVESLLLCPQLRL